MTDTACPECRDGKHRNCDGTAWDDATDALTACACAALPSHGLSLCGSFHPGGLQ